MAQVDNFRVHKNIIIIGDLSKTHRRSIKDQHVLIEDPLETNMPNIEDPSETYTPNPRPTSLIRDLYACSETNMHHRRPTCLISNQHASSDSNMLVQIPTCLIRDPSKTNMLDQACPTGLV